MEDFKKEESFEEEEELDNVLVLTDENGEETSFEFLDLIPYKGQKYVVLLPVEEDEDDDEDGMVVILQLCEGDESAQEDELLAVEDEATLEAVFSIFKEKFADEFDFAQEDE